ncbi:MAG TPA: universal stress protein [Terracidiphilus sp.]|jgi:nucleotide-binding universal stress UspA family protein|nr:universal stress protein [Terracidiphilus sp.]
MPETNSSSTIPTRILVPVDFSPSSRAALESAADLAQHFGAAIHLVHVVPMFPATTLPDFIPETKFTEEATKEAERHFAAVIKDLTGKGIKVSSSVEVGDDVASAILETVEREKADMVVISTHGLTGWHPLVFGSIAEKVMKLVSCPVLLLRTPKPASSAKVRSGRLMEWW